MAERVSKIPAGRAATPVEIAEFLYWLGSEHNGFVSGESVVLQAVIKLLSARNISAPGDSLPFNT